MPRIKKRSPLAPQSVSLYTRVPRDIYKKFCDAAERDGMTVATFVRLYLTTTFRKAHP